MRDKVSKRKTKEQKILSTLRKLQSRQGAALEQMITEEKSVDKKLEMKAPTKQSSLYNTNDYSYIRRDLIKIVILATLAIGSQVVLSFLTRNVKLPF